MNAQKAISAYYVLGYYTTNTAPDGKFRRISISLKEIPTKLDYRSGYFANKIFARFSPADKERQLEDALMLEDPVTELTVQLEVNYFQLNDAEYYVPVVMKIPGRELTLARRRGAVIRGCTPSTFCSNVRWIAHKLHPSICANRSQEGGSFEQVATSPTIDCGFR